MFKFKYFLLVASLSFNPDLQAVGKYESLGDSPEAEQYCHRKSQSYQKKIEVIDNILSQLALPQGQDDNYQFHLGYAKTTFEYKAKFWRNRTNDQYNKDYYTFRENLTYPNYEELKELHGQYLGTCTGLLSFNQALVKYREVKTNLSLMDQKTINYHVFNSAVKSERAFTKSMIIFNSLLNKFPEETQNDAQSLNESFSKLLVVSLLKNMSLRWQ